MPHDTGTGPGAPGRAEAGTRPPGRRPGRHSHPLRLAEPRLVPLTPEHERAALDALATLLAHDEGGDDR